MSVKESVRVIGNPIKLNVSEAVPFSGLLAAPKALVKVSPHLGEGRIPATMPRAPAVLGSIDRFMESSPRPQRRSR